MVAYSIGLLCCEKESKMYSPAKVYTGAQCPLKIIGFLGSVRENRMAERVAKYVQKYFAEKTQHLFELFGKIFDLDSFF